MSGKCELGYVCCICDEPIEDKDIPKECKEKIGMQLVWHNKCLE